MSAESDAFVELQDSMSVTSNNEADDVGMHDRWWKPSSPLGTSVGTPGAEFYDAFEGTNQFATLIFFIPICMPGLMVLLLKQC